MPDVSAVKRKIRVPNNNQTNNKIFYYIQTNFYRCTVHFDNYQVHTVGRVAQSV